MHEDELDIKRNEVKARLEKVKVMQDKVNSRHLAALYADLRKDLRDMNKKGDADDVKKIKEEMQAVQKQQQDLMAT